MIDLAVFVVEATEQVCDDWVGCHQGSLEYLGKIAASIEAEFREGRQLVDEHAVSVPGHV